MMNALRYPSLFRPTNRPPSPNSGQVSRLENGTGFERGVRTHRLSLSNFRRTSPVITPAALPVLLVQDGSYLEMLGLKLSEAVSKALAQPAGPAAAAHELVGGKQPLPAGRGHALGALIASELKATIGNPHLHRAIIRCLHRPLSVLVTNLSAQLLHLLSSPAFHTPLAPTLQAPNPNPTQLHALAVANFAGELLEQFDDLGLGVDGDVRADGLKVVREGLASVVTRVVNPLVGGIRNELMPLIETLENSNATPTKPQPALKSSNQHPSITALHGIIPVYARALSRYTTTATAQMALATFFISLIWRSLVALSLRPCPPPTPPASPTPVHLATKRHRGSPASSSPQMTPSPGRFTIKGPPSRPPSPLSLQTSSTPASDARALHDLLSLLPRPAANREATRLAREAIDEAFGGLMALHTFLEAIQTISQSTQSEDELVDNLARLSSDLPTLIALPPLLRVYGTNTVGVSPPVSLMLGLSEDEYRKGCLAGFGRAEECATAVSQQVLNILGSDHTTSTMGVVAKWLEAEIVAADN